MIFWEVPPYFYRKPPNLPGFPILAPEPVVSLWMIAYFGYAGVTNLKTYHEVGPGTFEQLDVHVVCEA